MKSANISIKTGTITCEMNVLKCRILTIKKHHYEFMHLINNEIRHGCSFLISSDSHLFRTGEYLYKTSQIAEETLVMTIDKAQETKLQRQKSVFH